MSRNKRLNVKKEKPESTFNRSRVKEEHDLAYFVHDRVELMRQVFSMLKPKEIKAMAPDSVRKLSNDDLEELCLEELLGISSKRLCAILDGAEPPSDTESSSDSDDQHSSVDRVHGPSTKRRKSQVVEVIDLDSASDVSQASGKNKKNKHKKKKNKEKHHKKKKQHHPDQTPQPSSSTEESASGTAAAQAVSSTTMSAEAQSRASRAGMTVLELLELQARARAIRAQLNAAAARDKPPAPASVEADAMTEDDDGEVEIKEEAPEVVEISSDEDKPKIEDLKKRIQDINIRIAEKVAEKEPDPPPPPPAQAQPPPTKQKKKKKQKEKEIASSDVTVEAAAPAQAVPTGSEPQSELSKSKKKSRKQKTRDVDKKADEDAVKTIKEDEDAVVVIDLDESTTESASSVANAAAASSEHTPDKQTDKNTGNENDFTIVIPRNIPSTARRVKLNRNNVVISVANAPDKEIRLASVIESNRVASTVKQVQKINSAVTKVTRKEVRKEPKINSVVVTAQREFEPNADESLKGNKASKGDDKSKKRKKDRRRDDSTDRELSDNYEITLQLSDSEKMDLLEDLDQKNLEKVSSSSSDSESTSESDGSRESQKVTEDLGEETQSRTDDKKVEEETGSVISDKSTLEKEQSKVTEDSVDGNPVNRNEDSEITENELVHDSTENYDKSVEGIVAENEGVAENIKTNEEELQKDFENSETAKTNEVEEMVVDTTTAELGTECENTTTKEPEIRPESFIAVLDNVNVNNINISTDKTIEVSCINDIPIVQEEFGPKSYEETNKTAERTLPMEVEQSTIESKDSSDDSQSESESDKELNDNREDKTEELQKVCENIQKLKDVEAIAEKEELSAETTQTTEVEKEVEGSKAAEKEPSEEGEITEESSSEIEAFDVKPDVVCISDGDDEAQPSTIAEKKKKNKKQKHKKCKKGEKCKKHHKGNFCEVADHNFFDQTQNSESPETIVDTTSQIIIDEPDVNPESDKRIIENQDSPVEIDSDDVYEILELSDDSSCYEVEGVSVLSKEPTSEEIEALSAKIDEIERVDVVTEEEIKEYEKKQAEKEMEEKYLENLDKISWKDRYLDSTKVKKVLTTSNILNAMRKKNKELKRKMEESKKRELEEQQKREEEELRNENKQPEEVNVEEGSIDHFNMLQGSTKYVDPVPEPKTPENENTNETNEIPCPENEPIVVATDNNAQVNLNKEMKKDAKQLLKMYKRLLKYNDINKQKERDPNKKKKKKQKRKKDGAPSSVASAQNI